jgi:hypothetical protein
MQTRLVSVRYDAAAGAFEARVDVERDGRTFRYPCRVEAPEAAPRDWVEAALLRHAQRLSVSDRPVAAAKAGPLHRFWEALARALVPTRVLSDIPVRATDPVRPRARLH